MSSKERGQPDPINHNKEKQMKTFKFAVEIFVQGESESDAAEHLIGELDYLLGVANTLIAYTHPKEGEETEWSSQ